MGIYRGPGGSGDATNDASSEARLAVEARDAAIAAKVAAEAARDAALIAETNAETAETNAEQAEVNAELAETNAEAAQAAAEAAQAAAEEARDDSINMAENFAVDVNTLAAGSSATVNYDNNAFLLTLGIPRGDTGATGADGDDGRGIVSITRTSGDGSAGTTDTYTITYTDSTTSTFQVYNGADGTGSGTVSSVDMTVPTGLTVSGNPITSSGTLAISLASGYAIPTTAKQTEWDTAYNDKVNSASFNTATGVLSLTQQDGGSVTVDLDGRYLTSETDSQTLSWNGSTGELTISSGNTVDLDGRYLTSYTETDPIYVASSWYSTTNNASDWNTAYGWGNHASAGYLTTAVTSATAGTGMSVSASTGAVTFTNTAPDQTVVLTAGTGISTSGTYPNFTVTNTSPDQTVAISSGTGISVSGTYPNFTVTNTAPSSGGTVTSVSGTAPIASSGGNTPTISISQASTSTDGYLSSTDWNTFNGKGSGTVTSVGLTAGTGISVSGSPITSSGSITVTNSAPMTYAGAGIAVSTGSAWGTSLTAPSGTIVGTSDTQTLTNKRITNRIDTVADAATITPTGDSSDQYSVTALAQSATIAAPSGTPTDGQRLTIRLKDNGTGRALTWTTSSGAYRAIGVTLPTTTVASKVTYVGCVYNSQDSYWDVVAVTTQA